MAGLYELIKIANKVSSNNYSGTKNLADALSRFSSDMKSISETFQANAKNSMNVQGTDSNPKNGQDNKNNVKVSNDNKNKDDQSRTSDMRQNDSEQQNEGTMKRNRQMAEVKAKIANTSAKQEIFSYDMNEEKLIEGLIFSEILGKPLSSRRRMVRHRHGRTR